MVNMFPPDQTGRLEPLPLLHHPMSMGLHHLDMVPRRSRIYQIVHRCIVRGTIYTENHIHPHIQGLPRAHSRMI